MQTYIDESGNFVPTSQVGSWSALAAFSIPDDMVSPMEQLLIFTKENLNCEVATEIKLKNFSEEIKYFRFLENLKSLGGLLFSIAYDPSVSGVSAVIYHKQMQVKKVIQNIDKMRYEGGRQGLLLIAEKLDKLSPQLYTQMCCQIVLMREVVNLSCTYFAQRQPKVLSNFLWRIDRCGTPPSAYEFSFEQMAPVLLQTMSLTKPLIKFKSPNFDYRYLNKLEIEVPSYFKDDYGIDIKGDRGLDMQKIIRGDMAFVDSKQWAGIQVVDLIVSGIRRLLKRGFDDNERAAAVLGSLMVEPGLNDIPIKLISFRKDRVAPDVKVSKLVKVMRAHAMAMIR